MAQKYRIIQLLPDGRQEASTAETPNYVSLERSLSDGHIKSFIISLV